MEAEHAGGDSAPSWQNYPWNREVRSKFLIVYVGYGFFLILSVLGTVSSVQQRNWLLAPLSGALSALIAFWVARAAYRHVWLVRHNRDRSGPVATSGRTGVWDAVRTNRVLTPEERPAAEAEARKLVWGPLRLFGNIFWPGTFAVGILYQLLNRHHTPLQTTILVMGLVMAAATQWGFVMQARLRRWMGANHLRQ